MNIVSSRASLSGKIIVPCSKSHTIRALLLATLSEGVSHIKNPLPSADCLSTAAAVPLLGAEVDLNLSTEGEPGTEWIVYGAGKNLHLPSDVVNVGNSGSLLYFLSPVAATFKGASIFTGDDSIRKRPVNHLLDALNQLGANCYAAIPHQNGCPIILNGPIHAGKVTTEGEVSSQYVSGMMMAGILLGSKLEINLTNPKETPYLTMTQKWLEKVGVKCSISSDFKKIEVEPKRDLKAFDCIIPSDWESVAFPLVAALISDSAITIENVDSSGTQGDDAVVEILKSAGADLEWNRKTEKLHVRGGKKAKNGTGRLSTENLPDKILHIKISEFPDAVCALSVAACFIEGTTIIEDAEVCRRKETDRLSALTKELSKLGAEVQENPDSLVIHGHSPVLADGKANPEFRLHGAEVESYDDHRMAMALSCAGLGMPEFEKITVKNSECCRVSFPHFYEIMNQINAGFRE